MAHALAGQRRQGVFHGWTDPRTARHALALESEVPVIRCETMHTLRNQRRRMLGFNGIWVRSGTACRITRGWRLDRSAGHAMRGKQHRYGLAHFRAERIEYRAQPLCKCIGEQRMIRPALHEIDLHPRRFSEDCAAIQSDAGARVLRRETYRDDLADAILAHLPGNVCNIWLPVAHADVNGKAKLL